MERARYNTEPYSNRSPPPNIMLNRPTFGAHINHTHDFLSGFLIYIPLVFGAKLRIIIFIAKIFLNKFNNCFLSTGKPRVTLIIHNSEGGVILRIVTCCFDRCVPFGRIGEYILLLKRFREGSESVEKTETGRLSAIREKS